MVNKKEIKPIIGVVLLLMVTVASAGAAFYLLTYMQEQAQEEKADEFCNKVGYELCIDIKMRWNDIEFVECCSEGECTWRKYIKQEVK